MKFEYLYVVFFVLSLLYKWYKNSKANDDKRNVDQASDLSSSDSFNAQKQVDSFEDLITQFQSAYGAADVGKSQTKDPEVEQFEVSKNKQVVTQNFEDVTPHLKAQERRSKASMIRSGNAAKDAEDSQVEATTYDLRQMVISSVILERPYK